ncbi:MAG: hypothetical protein ABL963_04765 [Longimicrobiales bacterium]
MIRVRLSTFFALATELEGRFGAGVDSPWTDADFEALALAAFAIQFESIEAYRLFCLGRGRTPKTVRSWQDVPPVPATAFKHFDFAVGSGNLSPEMTFRTSGTTRGATVRGRHLVPRASLYRKSLLPPFERHVLGGRVRMPFLSLVPAPAERPDSSLSFMIGAAAEAYATETSWLIDAQGALDIVGWRRAAERSALDHLPVVVLATSLALLHLVESLEADPGPPLPDGSRMMETGGFKGSGREIERGELHARASAATGVPSHRVVGEYGMTELLSQLYEPVLTEGGDAAGEYVSPPWMRVRALDPMTLAGLPDGHEGVLAFFDLANAGSVCHVLTEDVGSVSDGRVRLSGRARGAEPRGCSLAMDELLSAARAAGTDPA